MKNSDVIEIDSSSSDENAETTVVLSIVPTNGACKNAVSDSSTRENSLHSTMRRNRLLSIARRNRLRHFTLRNPLVKNPLLPGLHVKYETSAKSENSVTPAKRGDAATLAAGGTSVTLPIPNSVTLTAGRNSITVATDGTSVTSTTRDNSVTPATSGNSVTLTTSVKFVISVESKDPVVSATAGNPVVTAMQEDPGVPITCLKTVLSTTSDLPVVPVTRLNSTVPVTCLTTVVSATPENPAVTSICGYPVVAAAHIYVVAPASSKDSLPPATSENPVLPFIRMNPVIPVTSDTHGNSAFPARGRNRVRGCGSATSSSEEDSDEYGYKKCPLSAPTSDGNSAPPASRENPVVTATRRVPATLENPGSPTRPRNRGFNPVLVNLFECREVPVTSAVVSAALETPIMTAMPVTSARTRRVRRFGLLTSSSDEDSDEKSPAVPGPSKHPRFANSQNPTQEVSDVSVASTSNDVAPVIQEDVATAVLAVDDRLVQEEGAIALDLENEATSFAPPRLPLLPQTEMTYDFRVMNQRMQVLERSMRYVAAQIVAMTANRPSPVNMRLWAQQQCRAEQERMRSMTVTPPSYTSPPNAMTEMREQARAQLQLHMQTHMQAQAEAQVELQPEVEEEDEDSVHGLSEQTIRQRLETNTSEFTYSTNSTRETKCIICFEDFEKGETIRRLRCAHCYHRNCIDHWLTTSQLRCPMCRANVTVDSD